VLDPLPPYDELVAELADVDDQTVKAGKPELEEDAQDLQQARCTEVVVSSAAISMGHA
jgi:hypothetical protein